MIFADALKPISYSNETYAFIVDCSCKLSLDRGCLFSSFFSKCLFGIQKKIKLLSTLLFEVKESVYKEAEHEVAACSYDWSSGGGQSRT